MSILGKRWCCSCGKLWLGCRTQQQQSYNDNVLITTALPLNRPRSSGTVCITWQRLLISLRKSRPSLPTTHRDFIVPSTRTFSYDPWSFAVAGSAAWNSLPAPLHDDQLQTSFRRQLKTKLFCRAYDRPPARLCLCFHCWNGQVQMYRMNVEKRLIESQLKIFLN